MPTGNGGADDDDDDAFAEAMRGARPLPAGHERVTGSGRAVAPTPTRSRTAAAAFIVERTGDSIAGRAPDVAAKEVRSLRAGEREIDAMKPYLLSLGAGLLIGLIYSLLHVRSAPPVIALVGLLGMLAGEQIIPLANQYLFKTAIAENADKD